MGMVLGLLLVTSLVEEAERGFGGPLQLTLLPGMSCGHAAALQNTQAGGRSLRVTAKIALA
jgi:hypothetical protein